MPIGELNEETKIWLISYIMLEIEILKNHAMILRTVLVIIRFIALEMKAEWKSHTKKKLQGQEQQIICFKLNVAIERESCTWNIC